MRKFIGRAAALGAVLLLVTVGCGKKQASLPPPQTPLVDVANPVLRSVTDYEYFTGRTEASESVEIRARVAGYLTTAPVAKGEARNGEVKEGDDVEKGRLLFEIDSRPFLAEKERSEANIKQYEALTDTLERNYRTAVRSGSGVSQLDLIKISGDLAQAKANVLAAKASLKTSEINLAYTRIVAPFNGRISRRSVDVGNLVKADDTVLTTIVKLDPIQAYFDVDERTVLKFRDLLRDRQIKSARQTPLKVHLAMANEKEYTRKGVIDFVDNRLESGTGTLRIRVQVPNPGWMSRKDLLQQHLIDKEPPAAQRQGYDKAWSYDDDRTNQHYKVYHYKPNASDTKFRQQHVVYKPSLSKDYVYWYNPDTKKYWARCPTVNHPKYGKEVKAGKGYWSIAAKDRQPASLDDVKDEYFGKPQDTRPPLPGAEDGEQIENPPPDLPGHPFYYLSPGMFIRLRLPVGNEHQALLVPEGALASKQGQKVVYVVRNEPATDADGDPSYTKGGETRKVDRVYEIPVEPGQLAEDNWRVIKSSGREQDQAKPGAGVAAGLVGNVLKPGDKIVVSGLQRVRDKGEVRLAPKKVDLKPAQARANVKR